MGRPTKRTPEVEGKLFAALAVGMNNRESAMFAGVDPATFRRWRAEDDDFRAECEGHQAATIQRIAKRYLGRALDGEDKAAQFFLSRRSESFRDKGIPETQSEADDGGDERYL